MVEGEKDSCLISVVVYTKKIIDIEELCFLI